MSLSDILGMGSPAPTQQPSTSTPSSYGSESSSYGGGQSSSYGGGSSRPDQGGGRGGFQSTMLKDDDPLYPIAPIINVAFFLDKTTPPEILEKVSTLMASLAKSRFSVRYKVTGDAQVDFPIINGLNLITPTYTKVEVILPWKEFAIESIPRSQHAIKVGYNAKRVTAGLSSNWLSMKPAQRSFRAAETHLMLGKTGESPAIVLLTWSRDGAEQLTSLTDSTKYNKHMYRIAALYNIPIINLLNTVDAIDRLERVLAKYPFIKE